MACRAGVVLALLWLAASAAVASSSPRQDALLDGYFAIWADNSRVTEAAVADLYAPAVVYYGRRMSRAAVYRDKLAFIRHWPARRYRVAAGTGVRQCNAANDACTLRAVLEWQASRGGALSRGTTRIRLDLVRTDGGLKIARESGVPLRR